MFVNARIDTVSFTRTHARFALIDGREVAVPLDWFPALEAAPAWRESYAIEQDGTVAVWPELGERVSVAGIMTGRVPPQS